MCVRVLQSQHGLYNCAWSSLWTEHPGLPKWSLAAGDMFLLWAQQWRYIARALELGYSVRVRRVVVVVVLVAVLCRGCLGCCCCGAQRQRVLSRGFRPQVLRTDTDVYFAECPFRLLRGPLLSPFGLVVQQVLPSYSQVTCRPAGTPKLLPSYFLQVAAMRQTLF